ncbi:MAG TPA: hypothetical protein VI454_04260, partial [Verrucomicrobiae bacterium]
MNNSGANGDGRSSSPFNTLANAAAVDAVNDIIYIFTGGSNYTGGITLLNGEQVIGNGVPLIVAGFTLRAAGSRPTVIDAAGNGLNLAQNNTLSGFNFGNCSGFAIQGTNVGTLAANNMAINTTGGGVDLTGSSNPSVNLVLDSLTSSGGAKNVNLVALGGTVNLGSGALSNASGDSFLVGTGAASSGGNAAISYSGTIASGSAHSVNVNNMTGGSVSLSGQVTDNDTGITLTSNTGAVITFSGGITTNTDTSDSFTATGGGIVNVSGTNNITTTSGKGINWSADTSTTGVTFNNINSTSGGAVVIASSGASNFTFNAVTSTTGTAVNINTATGSFVFTKINAGTAASGPTKGITVNSLTGSFTVNGSGGLCDATHISGADCTGGTIQKASARGAEFISSNNITLKNMYFKSNSTTLGASCTADVSFGSNTTCNGPLFIQNATGVTLTTDFFDGSSQMGLIMNNVTTLNMTASEVSNMGSVIAATQTAMDLENLLGTSTISGCHIHDNDFGHNVFITNNTGTATINFTNNVVDNVSVANPSQSDGFQADSYLTANMTVNVSNTGGVCTFNKLFSNGVSIQASNGSTMNGTLSNCTITKTSGVLFQGSGTSNMTGTVTGNTITNKISTDWVNPGNGSNAITIGKSSAGSTATFTGVVTNNIITSAHCGGGCAGIAAGGYGNGTTNMTITGNNVQHVDQEGINFVVGQGTAGGTSNNVVTIQGNTVTNPDASGSYAIEVTAGTQNGDHPCVVMNLGDMSVGHTVPANKNNVSNGTTGFKWVPTGGASPAISAIGNYAAGVTATMKLPNLTGGTNDAAAQAWIVASNTNASSDAFNGGVAWQTGAVCPLLLLDGGVMAILNSPSVISAFMLTTQNASAPNLITANSIQTAAEQNSNSLSQPQLEAIVAAAIERWSDTGLTERQLSTLLGIKFEIADLSNSYLGEADGNRILIDRNAQGRGWFVDADPLADASFAQVVSATRRYTDSFSPPAGHIDLLTAIEHEMGHKLGLDDSYAAKDRESIMYGYLSVGERRVPAYGEARTAQPGAIAAGRHLTVSDDKKLVKHEESGIAKSNHGSNSKLGTRDSKPAAAAAVVAPVDVNIGSLPAGKTCIVKFQVAVNDPINNPASATQASTQGTVFFNASSVVTDDPAAGGASDPTTTPLGRSDLALTGKTDGVTSTTPGSTLTYAVAYSNPGRDAAGVRLNETVPVGTTFNAGASDAGWSCSPNNNAGSTCTFAVGALASGGSGSKNFAVTVISPA